MTSRLLLGSARTASVAAAFGAAAILTQSAAAQTLPDFTMTWTPGSNAPVEYDWNTFGSLNGFGEWTVGEDDLQSGPWTGWNYSGLLNGSFDDTGGTWDFQWNCVFNQDGDGVATGGSAFVTANIVVTNNDVVNQTFSLLMSLPVRQIIDPLERGSIVGTVTDNTFDDAEVFAPAGGQIYTPRIDGVDEAPGFLMQDPFSETAGGPLLSNTVGPQDFGIPNPVAATQDVDNSIAIFLEFELTPGDAASFTAIFEVLIPAPGALPALAVFGLLGRRRRRS